MRNLIRNRQFRLLLSGQTLTMFGVANGIVLAGVGIYLWLRRDPSPDATDVVTRRPGLRRPITTRSPERPPTGGPTDRSHDPETSTASPDC